MNVVEVEVPQGVYWVSNDDALGHTYKITAVSSKGEAEKDYSNKFDADQMFDFLCSKYNLIRISQTIAINPERADIIVQQENDLAVCMSDGSTLNSKDFCRDKPQKVVAYRINQIQEQSHIPLNHWIDINTGEMVLYVKIPIIESVSSHNQLLTIKTRYGTSFDFACSNKLQAEATVIEIQNYLTL